MLKCIIEEKDPPLEAQSGPWEKLTTQQDMQALAEFTGVIDKGQPLRRKLNVFFEDARSRFAFFTEEEWDFLNAALGREKLMNTMYAHSKKNCGWTDEELANMKQAINDARSSLQQST